MDEGIHQANEPTDSDSSYCSSCLYRYCPGAVHYRVSSEQLELCSLAKATYLSSFSTIDKHLRGVTTLYLLKDTTSATG